MTTAPGEKFIYDTLIANSLIRTLLGTDYAKKVCNAVAPAGVDYPYITFTFRSSNTVTPLFIPATHISVVALYQILAITSEGNSNSQAKLLADAIAMAIVIAEGAVTWNGRNFHVAITATGTNVSQRIGGGDAAESHEGAIYIMDIVPVTS